MTQIKLVNMTGEKVELADWERGNRRLAVETAAWLSEQSETATAISTTNDGAILIDYALNGVLQPTIRIYDGKVIWPKGSDFDLMMKYLGQ
jgi:hypothetical protein